jgi:voltage-gated potassium channel Kch
MESDGAARRGEPSLDAAAEDGAETPRERMARRKRATLVTIVVVWLASGAWVFSAMNPPMTHGPVQIIYLMVQIITTVGYGDVVPVSQEEKLAVTAIVMSSTLLVSNIIMAFVAEYVDKGADELASDMDSMTQKISLLKAEEERASVGYDRPTQELMAPNDLASKQQEQRWQRSRAELSISTAAFLVCLVIGVVFFKLVDTCNAEVPDHPDYHTCVHTWVDALYMSVVTMTTVGFGDIVPQSRPARAFATLWMLLGVAVTVRLLGSVSSVIDQGMRADVQSEMTRQLFHESDENNDGHLDEMEFMKLQLVQNGLASKFQIEAIRTQFRLIAGRDHQISMDEYAAYFLPNEKEAVKESRMSRWFRRQRS